MDIRVNVSVASDKWSFRKGIYKDVNIELAKYLISLGWADEVSEIRNATNAPVTERAIAKPTGRLRSKKNAY